MIWKLAWKFHRKNWHLDKEELAQVGFMALVRAFKDYNPKYNTKFITLAHLYAYRDILHFVKKNKPFVKNKQKNSEEFDDFLPNTLTEEEISVINMLKDGYKKAEIREINDLDHRGFKRVLDSAFNKIRKANEKGSVR